jgi:hypothetical protein
MILDKLLKTRDQGLRTIVHPLYQLFPSRLELIYFDEVKLEHDTHDFKVSIKFDMEKNGLLCPMVLDKDNVLRSGEHRFKILTNSKLADASLFYKIKNEAELNFLSNLNVSVWKLHSAGTPPIDFEFLFKEPMKKYTERCLHLFEEGIRATKVN